jgi:hypothetical protein
MKIFSKFPKLSPANLPEKKSTPNYNIYYIPNSKILYLENLENYENFEKL